LDFFLPPLLTPTQEDIPIMLFIEAGIATVLCLPFMFLMKSRPQVPPSITACVEKKTDITFLNAFKNVVWDYNFIILLIQFSLGFGAYNGLATLINQLFSPSDYSNDENGMLGGGTIVSGIVGSAIFGLLVDKTRSYKFTLLGCYLAGAAATGVLVFILAQPGRFVILMFVSLFLGFAMTPTLPLTFELGMEISYPYGEAISTGVLLTGANSLAIVIIVVATILVNGGTRENAANALYFLTACMAAAFVIMIFFFGTLKRKLKEDENQQNENERLEFSDSDRTPQSIIIQ